jgi:hypothetical protein
MIARRDDSNTGSSPSGSTHELRSSKTMESKRPLARATSGTGEGWGEGRKAFAASYFQRRGMLATRWVAGVSPRYVPSAVKRNERVMRSPQVQAFRQLCLDNGGHEEPLTGAADFVD